MSRKFSAEIRALVKRCDDARNFPINTCGASRHAQMIAERMAKGLPMDPSEANHCAGSILAVVAALWELRTRHPEPEPTTPDDRGATA